MSEQYTPIGVIGDRSFLARVRGAVGPAMRVAVHHYPGRAGRLSPQTQQGIARYTRREVRLHVVSVMRGQLAPVVSGVLTAAPADRRLLFLVEGDYHQIELTELRRACNERGNVQVVMWERLPAAVRAADLARQGGLRRDLGAAVRVTIRYPSTLAQHDTYPVLSAGLCFAQASPQVLEVNEAGVTIGNPSEGAILRLTPDPAVAGHQFEVRREHGGYTLHHAAVATVSAVEIDTVVLRLCAELIDEQDLRRAEQQVESSGQPTLIHAEITQLLMREWAVRAPSDRRSS